MASGPDPGTWVVDVANTIGARPDGWWRDRAAASSRLLTALARLVGPELAGQEPVSCLELVAVLEGQARAAGDVAGVCVVRAARDGDSEIVRQVEQRLAAGTPATGVLVVTADRGLRAQLPAGVPVRGPGWLWSRLDDIG